MEKKPFENEIIQQILAETDVTRLELKKKEEEAEKRRIRKACTRIGSKNLAKHKAKVGKKLTWSQKAWRRYNPN